MSTEYIVLARDDSGYWREIGQGEAATPKGAMDGCATKEGTYVAVPTRSWHPVALKIQKVERKIWADDNGVGEGPKDNGPTPKTAG